MKASNLKRVRSLLETLEYVKEKICVLKADNVHLQISAWGFLDDKRRDVVVVRNQNGGCLQEEELNPVIKMILLQQMEELKESIESDLTALGVDPNA